MSNLNYKQVANVDRRTWDVEAYEKKAAARKEQHEDGADGDIHKTKRETGMEKKEFQAAPEGAAGPEGSQRAFLQARKGKVGDIDERVGETIMVSVEDAAAAGGASSADNVVKKTGVGWHCSVCDCFLKDSLTYLDHINGRKHQRKLGFSMRVNRSTESDLMTKFNELRQKKSESKGADDEISFDKLVQDKDEQEQRRKEERQRKRKERKKLQKEKEPEQEPDDGGEEEEAEGLDPEMATMMGFSGFGGGNKKH